MLAAALLLAVCPPAAFLLAVCPPVAYLLVSAAAVEPIATPLFDTSCKNRGCPIPAASKYVKEHNLY